MNISVLASGSRGNCTLIHDDNNAILIDMGISTRKLKQALAQLHLNIEDLDLDNKKFSIIGKGNKERTGYLNDMTKEALIDYLKVRDTLISKKSNNTLFLSRYGTKMSSTAIEKIVKRAYKRAKIKYDNFCVHTLRHTCATLLYRNGIDIRTIQELLGHVQIDTTEIYTHLYDKNVMDVMLGHPLGKFMMADAKALCA